MGTADEYREMALLVRVRQGDAEAFATVYNQYRGRVLAFSYTLTKSKAIAEDITQDVFSKLWERREQIDPQQSFQGYLKKITFNQVVSFFRKVKLNKTLCQKLYSNMQLLSLQQTIPVSDNELLKLYQAAIGRLPAQRKKAYLLSREADLSYDQIAEEMGLSKNTVRNHIAEAIHFIRDYVARHYVLISFFLVHSF